MEHTLFDELADRGLIHQVTDEEGLRRHLQSPRSVYCGFDLTAPSLTLGNLEPILLLARLQRAGHRPVVVLGGATSLIGDPSGKSAERPLLDASVIGENMQRQRAIFERLLDFSDGRPNTAILLDNMSWISRISLVDALREWGKLVSVNELLQRDAVRDRLARQQGLTFCEFSYGLLQAIDFHHLHSEHGVTVQLGGSDQWSNILSGIDLVRRTSQDTVFGLTCPLITKADGTKFGKTESGSIWLSAHGTSGFEFYQFFLNTADSDVGRLLRLLTLLPVGEVEAAERMHEEDRSLRHAQRLLARELTTCVHGADVVREVESASQALFSGEIGDVPRALLTQVFAGVPRTSLSIHSLSEQPLEAVDLLCLTALCKSVRVARELLAAGAITVNGRRFGTADRVTLGSLLHGQYAAIRKGKRVWHLVEWT